MECILGRDTSSSKQRREYMDGRRRDAYPPLVHRHSRDTRPPFTDTQKEIVRETWKIIRDDIAKVGVITFMRLFEKYPDLQDLFVPFRGLTYDELRINVRLREHGLRVMGTVEKCIARLDEPENLERLLHDLGQKHVLFNTKVDYIDLIGPTLQHALMPVLGDKWTYEVEAAWSDFLKLIAHIMKESMLL